MEDPRNFDPVKLLIWLAAVLIRFLIISVISSFFISIIWNWLMTDLFSLPRLTFFQSWGLFTLVQLFLGLGYKGLGFLKNHKNGWEDKMKQNLFRKWKSFSDRNDDDSTDC